LTSAVLSARRTDSPSRLPRRTTLPEASTRPFPCLTARHTRKNPALYRLAGYPSHNYSDPSIRKESLDDPSPREQPTRACHPRLPDRAAHASLRDLHDAAG